MTQKRNRMKSNRTYKLAVATLTAVLALSAALPLWANLAARAKRVVPKTQAPKDTLPYNDRRRYDYFFIEAVRQQADGNYDAAYDLFQHCLSIRPDAAETYYALAAFYSSMDQDSTALLALEKAAALAPHNDTYQEQVALYYIGTRNYDRAIEVYENLYEHRRDRVDVLRILIQLYNQKKDYAKVITTVDRMEQADGPNDDLSLIRMQSYQLMGDKDKALEALRQLSDIHPNEPSYKVMLGNWMLQNGRQDEAYAYFAAALEDDPDNQFAQSSLFDYYRTTGQDSAALALRNDILFNQKTPSKTKTDLLKQIISESQQAGGDTAQVAGILTETLHHNPKDDNIAYLRAIYMQYAGMQADSVEQAYRDVLDIAPDNSSARFDLIQHIWPQLRWKDVIDLCQPGIMYDPANLAFYYFLGLAYYQTDEDALALSTLQAGTRQVSDESNADLVSDFYAIIGDIHHAMGHTEQAFAAYDSCLSWKDDNVACLNNYAYFLSEQQRDLQKAERMSKLAIKAEPGNATYLDTYAWILFLRGENEYARNYIEQAIEADTDSVPSSVILDHGGDINSVCGQMDRAVELWQRAIEAGGDEAVIAKKIRMRKPVQPKKTK